MVKKLSLHLLLHYATLNATIDKYMKINKRQSLILNYIRDKKEVKNKEIVEYFNISRYTVVRDLDILLKNKLIERKGSGAHIYYILVKYSNILEYINIDEYFKEEIDKRNIISSSFNFDIFSNLKEIFNKKEIKNIIKINDDYKKRVKKLSRAILKKELEKLTIDLSWKSSKIEGNTYSLIDTEILLKEDKEAKGHNKEEAIMLLNHKKALDYIFSNKKEFKTLTLKKIENLHYLLTKGLKTKKGLRNNIVGITGTKYRPLDNQYQIKEALEKVIKIVNNTKEPIEKAIILSLMISYIQPFEDGNKRTSRILSNAILIAYNYCPLSFRSIEVSDYKKAIILFYEQNNALFFKELYIEQFNFAVNNYFL